MYKAQASSDFYSSYGIDVSKDLASWDQLNADGLTASKHMQNLAEDAL